MGRWMTHRLTLLMTFETKTNYFPLLLSTRGTNEKCRSLYADQTLNDKKT